MSSFLVDLKRTHSCDSLRTTDLGAHVVLMGWVARRRDHGGRVFIDLRDREGLTQVVFGPEIDAAAHEQAGELRSEFCIGVAGRVVSRVASGGGVNPKLPTGEIEVEATRERFVELETPFMVKYTPGGATSSSPPPPEPRPLLRARRVAQIFKQLYMVAGFERARP